MNLSSVDLFQFLPLYMRDDETAKGFVYALQKQLQAVISAIPLVQIYGRIENLSEPLLDELAWQFNAIEYNSNLPIGSKIQIIKSCFQTHAYRGSKAAVEKMVNNVFGGGFVEEWFEYAGNAGYFKVHTSNQSTTDLMVAEFEQAIQCTQNVRSWLESVIVESIANMDMVFGSYVHTAEFIYV